MNPIHKFNNGRGATLCHLCRTIITVGKPTNDLYCDRCLRTRDHIEVEFLKLKANLKKSERTIDWAETTEDAFNGSLEVKAYYDQMEKEVHFNRGNLNI